MTSPHVTPRPPSAALGTTEATRMAADALRSGEFTAQQARLLESCSNDYAETEPLVGGFRVRRALAAIGMAARHLWRAVRLHRDRAAH